MTWIWWTLWLAAGPPVLGNPADARDWATSAEIPTLQAAEVLLLAHDPQGALARLRSDPRPNWKNPRWVRLEAQAFLAIGDDVLAERRIQTLGRAPGWRAVAYRQAQELDESRGRSWMSRVGLGLFALSLALLGWAGARELLRISKETLVFAATVVAAVGLARQGSPVVGMMLGLWGVATAMLVHAAFAAVRRILPGVRGRLLLAVLVAMGSVGALVAQGAQVGWKTVWVLLQAA